MSSHTSTPCPLDRAAPRKTPTRVRSNRRWALTVLLACLLGLLALPSLADAVGTGSITGTVTNTEPKALEGASVEVLNAKSHEFIALGTTNSEGKYEVKGLAAGEYVVEFFSPPGGEYAPQYFDEKHAFERATPVHVLEGMPTEAIDAQLRIGAKISGKVEAEHKDVGGVFVVVYGVSEGAEPIVEFTETNASGDYAVQGLPEGEYEIEFLPPGNLVPLYYKEGESFEQATTLKLKEELAEKLQTVTLQVGGEISGTVTDAVTHKPLAGVGVEAINARGPQYFGGYAETNQKGEYTVMGLGGGAYNVKFYLAEAEETPLSKNYIAPAIDNGVTVISLQVTGINLALVPKAPNNNGAPVASGTPVVGQRLSCSTGSWSGLTPLKFAYQWLRDGKTIEGATESTYTVQTADQGHGLSCEVTATNGNGHASAASNTLVAPVPIPPPPPPPTPRIAFSTTKLVVSRGAAKVRISCAAAPCEGAIELTKQITVRHRIGGRTVSHKETLVLAKGVFALAAGHSGVFVVHLTRTGKSTLAHAPHHRLVALLVVSVRLGKTIKGSIAISDAAPRHR